MSWEISITQEGWQNIQNELNNWSREMLVNAISDDYFEMKEHTENEPSAKEMEWFNSNLKSLPFDILVDRAFELIQENNTCDNGGFNYWVDREGYHTVKI